MSVQLAPPLVVISMNPLAAPSAMRLRSVGLTLRLYGLDRKRRAAGRPGDVGAVAEPMRMKLRPPSLVRHTRELVKWKNTRPVASSGAGGATIAVKKPAPAESVNAPRATQFWNTSGGLLLKFVRIPEPCELPSTVFVFAWLYAAPMPSPPRLWL